jgi:aerobic carbon-monoxide dehydrogenase medium subunit
MRILAPSTVAEAVALLDIEPNVKVFAGATDLIPQLRAGRPEPDVLVDLKHIDRLTSVTCAGNVWTVGAALATSNLTRHAAFCAAFPGLSEASGLIGSDQIQNRSSWGGNLCNASPAADSVPALVANDARAVIASSNGERTIPVSEVVTGPGRTSLAAGEFLVEFEIDAPEANTADAYLRVTPRTEMDIAIVGAAVRLTMDGAVCTAATVVLGAVAPTVVRVPVAEAALVGSTLDEEALAAVAKACSDACDPIDDKRGTTEYRRQVSGVLATRAARLAADRARGGR